MPVGNNSLLVFFMNNKQLSLIHILKNQLNLDENTYRSILWETFEVNSSKDLSPAQASDLIDWLKRQLPTQQAYDYNNNFLSNAQRQYILDLSRNTVTNLRAFCSKIVHRNIENIDTLTKKEAISVINALKRYNRKKYETAAVR